MISPAVDPLPASHQETGGIAGHPRGLTTLFFTEMWERFSYYGMRALLVLFMTLSVAQGGLGFSDEKAATIYGNYTMSVYLLGILGCYLADNFIGGRQAVLVGGIIIACGHFSMALHSEITFFAGLILVACGTGLLKPKSAGAFSCPCNGRTSEITIIDLRPGSSCIPLMMKRNELTEYATEFATEH